MKKKQFNPPDSRREHGVLLFLPPADVSSNPLSALEGRLRLALQAIKDMKPRS